MEKRSDAVKIECVFGRLDVLKELQSLLRTTHSYLSHVSDSGTSRVVQPAISSLEFAVELQETGDSKPLYLAALFEAVDGREAESTD